jgi:hypothetical protein
VLWNITSHTREDTCCGTARVTPEKIRVVEQHESHQRRYVLWNRTSHTREDTCCGTARVTPEKIRMEPHESHQRRYAWNSMSHDTFGCVDGRRSVQSMSGMVEGACDLTGVPMDIHPNSHSNNHTSNNHTSNNQITIRQPKKKSTASNQTTSTHPLAFPSSV